MAIMGTINVRMDGALKDHGMQVLDRNAYEKHKTDFEDDLNAWSAYRNGVDVIVTRDLRGFRKFSV